MRAGGTVPIRLQICTEAGGNLSSPDVTLTVQSIALISRHVSGVVVESASANPDATFRYDPTLGSTGGYILNQRTGWLQTGVYELALTAGTDPYLYRVTFQVR